MSAARRIARAIRLAVAISAAWIAPSAAFAGVPEGLAWLRSQPNADGSFGGKATSLATPYQSTAEVLVTSQLLGREAEPPYAGALAFLNASAMPNTESLARRTLVTAQAGLDVTTLVTELLRRQNRDGGFGEQEGYASSVLDTAFALQAVAAVPQASAVPAAAAFLLGRQQPDGGWADGANETSVYLTALASRSLSPYRFTLPGVGTAVQNAQSFLLAARTPDTWGEAHLTALALGAIVPNLVDLAPVSPALAALAAGQLADGSWEQDAYTTALALRALQLASLPRRDPTLGTIGGRVVDAQTDQPLTGVTAVLTGAVTGAVDTAADGAFEFRDLPSGEYAVRLSRAEYAPIEVTVASRAGAVTDIGVLRLSKQAAATTGTVRGVVTDATTGAPIAGALVAVASGPSATTDVAGVYQMVDVAPGAIVVEASRSGYASQSGSGTLEAGGVLLFSPALVPGTNNATATLVGTATRASDGTPLAGVTIAVTGASTAAATTALDGSYSMSGLSPGTLQLRASLAGFDDVSGAIDIVGNSTVDFSPRMHATGTTPDGGASRVSGRVVDAGTSEPIRGALVSSSSGQSVITGADGRFSLPRAGAGRQPIAILSTGVAAPGVPLVDGLIDPHWQIVSGTPTFPGPNASVFRHPAWVENSTTSKWIAPVGADGNVATYVYRTTFDLDGLDPRTASLSGLWATDNLGLRVLLNGVDTGIPPSCAHQSTDFSCFNTLRAFSIPVGSAFAAGTNTLDFVVLNGGGPAGLRVDISGTADPLSQPALELSFSAPGYVGGTLALNWGLAGVSDVGDVRLVPEEAAALLPDLAVSRIDRAALVTNPQTLEVSGSLTAFVTNTGSAPMQADTTVTVFEDRDGDSRLDPLVDVVLGSGPFTSGLGVGELGVVIAASGTVSFRDGVLHAVVDPEQSVAESDETNNTTRFESCDSAQLPFIDNFNDDDESGWRPLSRGNTQASSIGGEYVRPGFGSSYVGSTGWTDYRAEIKLRFPAGHQNDAGLVFRARNANDFFSLRIQSGLVRLLRFSSGGGVSEVRGGPITVLSHPERYHTIRADVAGAWVRTYLNDQLIFEHDGLDWEAGAVGTENDGVLVHYEDLRVTPLTLVEDFDDGNADGWRPLSYGSAPGTVVGGEYVRNGMGSSAFGSASWKNYSAEVRVRFPDGPTNDGALAFIAKDASNWAHLGINGGLVRLAISGLGVVRSANVVLPDPLGWQTIKAEVRGRTVRCFINGQFVFDFDQLPWENGAVGTVQDGVLVHYDDLRIAFAEPSGAPDASASRLVVEDLGATARFTVRAGLGGGAAPAGLPVAFYGGDPTAGGILLGTAATTGSLAAGQFEDVAFTYAGSLSGLAQVVAVVDDDGTGQGRLAECNEANNRIGLPIDAVPGVFSIQLATDQPSYGPNADLHATATLTTAGSLSRVAQVRFSIETADGVTLLAELPLTAPVLVAPGASVTVEVVWNTGTTLTGSYRVRATLVAPGAALGAVAPFALTSAPGALASARLTTDKASYLPSDVVHLGAQATNVTSNAPLEDLRLTTTVRNPDGSPRFSRTEILAQLVPGGRREFEYPLALAFAAPGAYAATLSLQTVAGAELAAAAASFTVQSTADTGSGLAGSLEAAPRAVPLGDPVRLGAALTNRGNAAFSGLDVVLRVIDPEAQTVLAEFTRSVDLAQGASLSFSETWSSQGSVGATYLAALYATIGGTNSLLAQDRLTIEPAPVQRLLVEQALAKEARVLGYVGCGSHDEKGHDGRRDSRSKTQRCPAREQLDALLLELGVRHLVTPDETRFVEELRSGRYNVYVLAGRMRGEMGDVASELREAVRRGDGLLVDGSFDDDSQLEDVTGAEREDSLRFPRITMQVNGPLYTPASLDLVGGAWKLEPSTGAVQATFPAVCRDDDDDDHHDDDDDDHDDDDDDDDDDRDRGRDESSHRRAPRDLAAIVSNNFGDGRAIAFAFDFLANHGTAKAAKRAEWRRLLFESLQHLTPEPRPELGPLGYTVLTTSVTNAGLVPTEVELAFTLPAGLLAEDSEPKAAWDASGVLRVRAPLAAGATREFRLGLRVPEDPGGYSVETVVSTCAGVSCDARSSHSFPLEVVSSVAGADDVIAQLRGLGLSRSSDRAARDEAVRKLERGLASLSRGDEDRAISDLIQSAKYLGRIRGANVSSQQLEVARILAESERQWWDERR